MLRASEAAWLRNDFQQSIELLERAAKAFPNDACILLDLGRARGLRYDYALAEQCFEKAIRVANWRSEAFIAAGLHCRSFNHLPLAERYFERALKKDGKAAEALVQLAEIHERRSKPDVALELAERALAADPNSRSALLLRARLDRRAGRLETAEALLRAFASTPHPDAWTRAAAWYELGGILDRQERYDDAMSSFLEAKAILRPGADKYIQIQRKFRQQLQATAANVSAEDFRRWHERVSNLEQPHRHVLLAGHPRSGTTLLEQVLDAHPEIVSAEETQIFSTDAYRPLTRGRSPETPAIEILNEATPGQLDKSRADYWRLMEKFLGSPIGERVLVDKNPSLTAHVPAVARIFPETKFLIALRDPRDVCLSCFMQPLPLTAIASSYLTLEETASEFVSLMGFWKSISGKLANPWLEVRYEDVVQDLASTARRALEFLEAPWNPRVLSFDEHARNKLVRSPTYADVVKPVFKGAVGRWKHYQKYIEPVLPDLAPVIAALGYE